MPKNVSKEDQGFVGSLVWRYYIDRYENDTDLYATFTLSDMSCAMGINKEEVGKLIEVLTKFKTELGNV